MTINWMALFAPGSPPLEMFVRGTVIYAFIFVVLRMAGRRDTGSVGVADLLMLMLIADAAGNAMAGDSSSVLDGMIVVATIIFWSVLVDRVAYWCPGTRRWLQADRVCLVHDGQLQRRGMRREYLTPEELMSELRLQGVENVAQVKRAYMEPSGDISVIKK